MENKRLHFELEGLNSGFGEKRLVFMAPPLEGSPGPEAEKKSPEEEKAMKFLDKLTAKCVDLPGFDKAELILRNNPFAKDFVDFASKAKDDYKAVDYSKKGRFVLIFDPMNESANQAIAGREYAALFWNEIKVKMDGVFSGKGFSEDLYVLAGETKAPAFEKLAIIFAEGKTPTAAEIEAAEKELEGLKRRPAAPETQALRDKAAETAKESKKERIKASTAVETSALRDELKKQSAKVMAEDVDKWKIAIIGRSNKINADKWDIGSQDGLVTVKQEWTDLQIYKESNPFFKDIFAQLAKASDPDFLQLRSPQEKSYYMNPVANLDKLKSIDPAFAESVEFFLAVKQVVMQQDAQREDYQKLDQEKNEIGIAETATRAVKENVTKFRDALRDRDYATAAVYVVGIYAMYKTYKMLGDKGDKVKNAFFIGAALGTAHLLAKNAGFDVLKKFGINSLDHDVKGTSLEAMYHLNIPEMKDVPDHIVRDAALININSLHQRYLLTNKPGSFQFIDPAQFPDSFPEFQGMHPSEVDQDASLDMKQKKYRETGQKLYLLVAAMEKAYDKTLKVKYGKSFGEVVSTDPVLSKSSVLDFTTQLMAFVRTKEDRADITVTTEYANKVRERFSPIFDKKGLGFSMDSVEIKDHPGSYYGTIKGYPVVIERDKKTSAYFVFDRGEFDKSGGILDESKALGKIPYEGDAESGAVAIGSAIETKMKALVAIFVKGTQDAVTLTNINFENGSWKADLDYKRAPLLKAKTGKVRATIATKDGNTLSVINPGGDTLVHVQDVTDKEALFGSLVLAEMVNQKESTTSVRGLGSFTATDFSPLMYFYKNGKLKFVDGDPGDKKFKIKIGNVSIDGKDTFEVEFEPNTGVYMFVDKTLEGKLVKDHTFKNELGGTLLEESEFKEVSSSLRDLVNNTPQSYFLHFFKSVPKWFTEATLHNPVRGINLKDFTGSVPKQYVLELLDAKQQFLASKLKYSLDSASKFGQVSEKIGTAVAPGVNELKYLRDKFSRLNTKNWKEGDNFSEEGFMADIMNPLMAVGIESENYKVWYKQFVDETFLRYGMDDLRKGNAIKAKKQIEIFGYYTSVVDDATMDGANTAISLSTQELAEIDKFNKTVESLKTSSGSPTDALIAKNMGLAEAEIPRIRKISEQKEKVDKYNLYADYVSYVVDQINLKRNETDNFGDIDPPGPGTYWGIKPFDDFKINRVNSSNEFIDRRLMLRLSSDYVTFESYMAMPKAERDKIKKDDVILPRSDSSFTFNLPADQAEYDLYKKLKEPVEIGFQPTEGVVNRMTEVEKAFSDKLNHVLDQLEKKYPNEYKAAEFEKLRHIYTYLIFEDTETATPSQIDVVFDFEESRSLSKEISDLESKWRGKTMTRSAQENFINTQVETLINKTVLDNSAFDKYFDRNTLPKKAGELWEDLKYWVWGVIN